MNTFDEIPANLPLSEQVEIRIRDAITSGRMTPNVIYTETSIAEQMRVSRTPVREAVMNLASRGFVTVLPRRGFQVRIFSKKSIHDVYDLRWALESHAVRTLSANPEKYDLSVLARAAEQQKESAIRSEINGAVSSGRDFHHELLHLTGNSMVDRVFEDIRDIISVTWSQAFTHSISAIDVASDHMHLVDLIKKGESDSACALLKEHLQRSEKAVLEAQRKTEKQYREG